MPFKIIFNIVFLPIVILIGFFTSRDDFLRSKIRNKWILMGLIYSFCVYLISWILYWLRIGGGLNLVIDKFLWNFDRWAINLAISCTIGYLLWHFKMWGAGDAKLFIAYAALIPMRQYSKVYFNYYFASFFLLLAIFIPATLFILINSITYFIKKFNFSVIKKKSKGLFRKENAKFKIINVLKILLGFLVFFLFFKIIREEAQNVLMQIVPNQKVLMLISLVAFEPLSRIFRKNNKSIVIAFAIMIAYALLDVIYLHGRFIEKIAGSFVQAISLLGLFPLCKKIVYLYSKEVASDTTPFAHWIFLGALIAWFS